MSYLSVGAITQFLTTAACDFALRKADVDKGYQLCSVLTPVVQVAGSYVYHKAIQKTSDVPPSFGYSSSLNPIEEVQAATLGAYAGAKILEKMGYGVFHTLCNHGGEQFTRTDKVLPNPLVTAGVAAIGTNIAVDLADTVKAYLSQASSTAERAPKVCTKA